MERAQETTSWRKHGTCCVRNGCITTSQPGTRWSRALRELRDEDGRITNRRAQMEYLRELRNAKTLRSVVLQSFIEFGEAERDEQEVQVDGDPRPRPRHHRDPQARPAKTTSRR